MNSLGAAQDRTGGWTGYMPALGSVQQPVRDPSGEWATRQGGGQGLPGYQPDPWGTAMTFGIPLWSLERRRPSKEKVKEDNEWGTTPKKGGGTMKTVQNTKGQRQELQNRLEALTPEDQGDEEEENIADVDVEVAQRVEKRRCKGIAQTNTVNNIKPSGIPDLEDSDGEGEEDPNEKTARSRNQEATMWHRDPRPNKSRKDKKKEAHAKREKRINKDNEGF